MIYVIAVEAPSSSGASRVAEWVRTNFERYASPLDGVWIVSGPLAAEQILTALRPMLGSSDRLVIVKAATEAVWQGLDDESARWLAEAFPGSITERIPRRTEGVS